MTTLLDLDKINVQLDLDSVSTFRLGRLEKNQSLPRLLKVRFKDPDDAQNVIHNKKNINMPDNITCNSDKTFMQRSMIKNAVIEFKNRESRGEKNLAIKRIHNVPKVISVSTVQPNIQSQNSKRKSNNKVKNRSNY